MSSFLVPAKEEKPKEVNMAELEAELDAVGRTPEQKSIEDLTEVRLIPIDPERFFLVGSQLKDAERAELVNFLMRNRDVFE